MSAIRPETGPMQFGADWRGVFIRGDNAFGYSIYLRRLLEHAEAAGWDPIARLSVSGFARILEGADERDGRVHPTEVQMMRPFAEAVANHESVAQIAALNAIADEAEVRPQRDHEQATDRSEAEE